MDATTRSDFAGALRVRDVEVFGGEDPHPNPLPTAMEVVRELRFCARAGAGEEHAGGGTERLPIGGGKVDWGSSVARAPARALNGIGLSGREW